jgi:hypothetical protein
VTEAEARQKGLVVDGIRIDDGRVGVHNIKYGGSGEKMTLFLRQ